MTEARFEPKYAYWGTAASIAFFCCLNWLVDAFREPPASVSADSTSRWKWKNLVISWIHAFVCGCWVLSNLVLYPEFMDDLVGHFNAWSYAMVCFSVGYFTYDFLDMLVHKKLLALWELVAHHIAITSVMIYNLLTTTCIAWNIVALSAEVNSFFLHTRKLMQMHCIPKSHPLCRANKIANMATFVVFRFGSAVLISAGMLLQHERVTTTYMVMLGMCMTVMNLVNPILFWRLLRSDVFGGSGRGSRPNDAGDCDLVTSEHRRSPAVVAAANGANCRPARRHPHFGGDDAAAQAHEAPGCDSEMPFMDLGAAHCMQSALSLCHINGTVKLDKLG